MEHKIKYERSTLSRNWAATCSCGWVSVERDATAIIRTSDAHANGTDWVEADPRNAADAEVA
jgi:hypothetical protein